MNPTFTGPDAYRLGDVICDMHYGQHYPFILPQNCRDRFKVAQAITFQAGAATTDSINYWQWIEQVIKRATPDRYRSYTNKMLYVVDERHSEEGTKLVCAYCKDGYLCGLVELIQLQPKPKL